MIFPIDSINEVFDEDKRDEIIQTILSDCEQNDPPYLSHLIVNGEENGVPQVMEALASGQYGFVWKIQVLRDEWGKTLRPGDKVVREFPKNRTKRNGDLVSSRQLTQSMRDGSYKQRYEGKREYILDAKLCIECGFEDAVYFLKNWGYNRKSGYAVTKKPEYSFEPVDMRDSTKGNKKHVHYWRYAEMDNEDYGKLPTVGITNEDDSKARGKR